MTSKIQIIQGDTVKKTIAIRLTGGDKLNNNVVQKIYFTCGKLNLQKDLSPKKDKNNKVISGMYVLELTSTETSTLSSGNYTYDLTIQLGAGNDPRNIKTVSYQYPLEVLKKNNHVTY